MAMAQQGWRCPTCGATNPFGNGRCRICQLVPPPALIPQAAPSRVYTGAPAPPPVASRAPSPVPPAPILLPPPGGWQPPNAGAAPPMSTLPPPPGAPPPPGWYPTAPTRRSGRRGWIIAACIVVPLVLLGVGGFLFARSTDPAAARDRDAAENALLTNSDLGGTFHEVLHRAVARTRGGIRVDEDVNECAAAGDAFENHGVAVVDSLLQSQSGLSMQLVAEEVAVVETPDAATPVLDSIVGTTRECVQAAMQKGAGGVNIAVSLSAAPAPSLGDRAARFEGTAGAGAVGLSIDIVVVQQGRAIVMVMTVDTTGSLGGRSIESMTQTLLSRLQPHFST